MATTTTPLAALEVWCSAHTRLTGDAPLMGMITGVFALPVPEGQAFPYISYGPHYDSPWPTFGQQNSDLSFLLNIHSQQGGEECYAILAEVIRLLQTTAENPPLTLEHYGHVGMRYEWSTALYEADSGYWNMPVRFRSWAVENTSSPH